MKQQSLTWFSWKKLMITFIIIVIVSVAIYLFMMNKYIKASKTEGFDHTESIILNETNMTSVHNMYSFQDDILYHIAYALDKHDKEWLIFVPKTEIVKEADDKDDKEDKNKENNEEKAVEKKEITEDDLLILEAEKVKMQTELEAAWQEECNQCALKSSLPAFVDNTPAWELTYIDDNKRFVMEYRSLEDSEIIEQLKLRRKYNVKG